MTKNKKTKQRAKEREKKPYLKKIMRLVFFFQTSNMHLIKQKYKKKLNYFYYKNIRKTKLKKKINK
jgi:hypothetical protein